MLPTIRKTGQYGGALTSEQALILAIVQSDAPENRALALSEYREAITAPLQAVIEEQKPKVTYYDVVMRSDDLIPTTVIAKDYGFSASKLNSLLNEFSVQFQAWWTVVSVLKICRMRLYALGNIYRQNRARVHEKSVDAERSQVSL